MKIKRKIFFLAGLVIALASVELAARLSGATDFPIYQVDATIGYIPAKNQSGRFLNKNQWIFNELSMGAGRFTPGSQVDTLLVGDSIVLGGNPISQEHRLGPLLSKKLGAPVWPISAGSWSISNELTYLRLHPEVVEKSDRIVFVLNGGDLVDEASHWRCERYHPRVRPWSSAWYLLDKNLLHLEDCETFKPEMTPPVRSWRKDLGDFLMLPALRGKNVYVVIYPDVNEIKTESVLNAFEKKMSDQLASFPSLKIIKVGFDRRWARAAYRDGIHPSEGGNKTLADIIADHIWADGSGGI